MDKNEYFVRDIFSEILMESSYKDKLYFLMNVASQGADIFVEKRGHVSKQDVLSALFFIIASGVEYSKQVFVIENSSMTEEFMEQVTKVTEIMSSSNGISIINMMVMFGYLLGLANGYSEGVNDV